MEGVLIKDTISSPIYLAIHQTIDLTIDKDFLAAALTQSRVNLKVAVIVLGAQCVVIHFEVQGRCLPTCPARADDVAACELGWESGPT